MESLRYAADDIEYGEHVSGDATGVSKRPHSLSRSIRNRIGACDVSNAGCGSIGIRTRSGLVRDVSHPIEAKSADSISIFSICIGTLGIDTCDREPIAPFQRRVCLRVVLAIATADSAKSREEYDPRHCLQHVFHWTSPFRFKNLVWFTG
jgi:hypothetical protein